MGIFNLFKKKKKTFEQLYDEILEKAYNEEIHNDDLEKLNHKEQVFFVLSVYEMEIMNGGLCQFFVNSSRVYASLICDALKEIDALEHLKLYQDFIENSGIDLINLEVFDIKETEEFMDKVELYPFDDFDESYYDLKPLCEYLEEYMNK